ncbi:MAG: hypothetical protein OCC49_17375 [Fibrobacterales bacterium]
MSESINPKDLPMELGVQPIDALMEEYALKNNDLVAASTEQLSHKIVGKARKGRKITKRLQRKVIDAFNSACHERFDDFMTLKKESLFNY